MADLSDLTAYLATTAANAVYPNGTSSASVVDMDCRIYEGWPIPDQLDLDMAGQMMNSATPPVAATRPGGPVANVSIFPAPGAVEVYQIQDYTYTITAPAINVSSTVSGDTITVSGQVAAGEFMTLVCDDAFVYSAGGATTAAMLQALATAAQANYPAASATATTLTVPVSHALVVRHGGSGVQGKVTHRQKHSVMVTVWAPNRIVRNELAGAIDNAIKQTIKVAMPDTSQAIIRYNRTLVNDTQQSEGIYRRDLIYDVEYATVEQFTGVVITSTTMSIVNAAYNSSAIATALT